MEFMSYSPARFWHLVWLLPLLAGIIWFACRLRSQRLARLIPDTALRQRMTANLDRRKRRRRLALLAAALALMILALGRIQSLPGEELTRPARGRDVLILFDVSRSMLATDTEPSRLEHARAVVHGLTRRLPGDRFGLIAFSGSAFVQCPLTFNRPSFKLVLDDLDTRTIPVGGSNLEKALQAALKAFAAAEGPHQAIVLITDGEELQGDAARALAALRRRRVPVHVIGVGDPELGSFIPLPGAGLLEDGGKPVRSRLNEGVLKRIAAAGNGLYIHSTTSEPATDKVGAALSALVPATQNGELKTEKPRELFQWPLGLAVVCLLIALVMGERRRLPAAAAVLLLLFALPAAARDRDDDVVAGLRAEIEEAYDITEFARLEYNLARHFQNTGKFDEAEKHYDTVIASGGADASLRGATLQNLGVMLHVRAGAELKSDPASAISRLQQTIKHYTEALRLRPGDKELAANLQLARRDLQQAHDNRKIENRMNDELAKARKQTRRALDNQRRAGQEPDDRAARTAAADAAAAAQKLVRQLVETATLLHREKDYAVAERQIIRARNVQQDLLENPDPAADDKAAALLLKAFLLLGGSPDAEPKGNQQKQNRKPPPKGDPVKKKVADQLKILKQLQDEEAKLRRQQKDEKAKYREPQGKKNW